MEIMKILKNPQYGEMGFGGAWAGVLNILNTLIIVDILNIVDMVDIVAIVDIVDVVNIVHIVNIVNIYGPVPTRGGDQAVQRTGSRCPWVIFQENKNIEVLRGREVGREYFPCGATDKGYSLPTARL